MIEVVMIKLKIIMMLMIIVIMSFSELNRAIIIII